MSFKTEAERNSHEKSAHSYNLFSSTSTGNNKLNAKASVQSLGAERHKNNPFDKNSKDSKYDTFPDFDGHILNKLDTTKVIKWATTKYKEFENIINM